MTDRRRTRDGRGGSRKSGATLAVTLRDHTVTLFSSRPQQSCYCNAFRPGFFANNTVWVTAVLLRKLIDGGRRPLDGGIVESGRLAVESVRWTIGGGRWKVNGGWRVAANGGRMGRTGQTSSQPRPDHKSYVDHRPLIAHCRPQTSQIWVAGWMIRVIPGLKDEICVGYLHSCLATVIVHELQSSAVLQEKVPRIISNSYSWLYSPFSGIITLSRLLFFEFCG